MASKATASWNVRVDGVAQVNRVCKLFGETDAPFLREALDECGAMLARETVSRAPGGLARATRYIGIRGRGMALRAIVQVKHPGSRSMEFGRKWYYAGAVGAGNNSPGLKRGKGSMKRGKRVARRGQKARPYAGITTGGGAMGAIADEVREKLATAYAMEFERVANGGQE